MSETLKSVLLVDDNLDTCNIFEIVMTHHQIPFAIVNDAEAAMDYLKINEPAVVLMDILLPGIDGYQALEHLRMKARFPNCKVVATTAYYTDDTEKDIISHGFDGYVPKPFDPIELVHYLESIV